MIDVESFKRDFHFDPISPSPRYVQLYSFIKHQIKAGVFKVNDQLIAENELCEILNVSRTTVRLAMDQLINEGLIVRYRGKGSFIAEEKIRRKINYLYNFTNNMQEVGAKPSSIVLESIVITADDFITQKLALPTANRQVFKLMRIRCANDNPLLLETTYIPYYLCEGIEHNDFHKASLYRVLTNEYSLNLFHAEETIEAILIEKEQAEYLDCKKKMPGYKIERISHLDNGYIFEYTKSVTRADKCVFKLDLYKNNTNNIKQMEFSRLLNA